MIPSLRKEFNRRFRPELYQDFLRLMYERAGTEVKFRLSETPCFFPRAILDRMAADGQALLGQLVSNPSYEAISEASIPPDFRCPRQDEHPLFVQADFGLVRNDAGDLEPKLVEIQGFPSLYGFQPELARCYIDAYGLDPQLHSLLGGLSAEAYREQLCHAICGSHAAENVVLLEIDPRHQKTVADFNITERLCGVRAVCITEVVRERRQLFYRRDDKLVPIRRIYNRVIVDELQRRNIAAPFSFADDLDVEWAGHPNWFFRISKFSIPYLDHPCVPKTKFLNELDQLPENLDRYVLKPLYSFAGLGVIIGPTREEVDAVPAEQRASYILQERMHFEPVIETPHGMTQAEVRIMYLWTDQPRAVTTIVRMGRGKMMGVDHNRDLEWVGASAALTP